MYTEYNPNPFGRRVDDCAVRAVAKALSADWMTAYAMLCDKGAELGDMPHADSVWGAVLREYGFVRHIVPNTCIKLAAYYTILNEMDKGAEPPPTYSMAASPPDDRIYMDSDTEFATVVDGADRRTFFEVMDELMETIRILNPPLYAGVLRKFK